MSTLIAVTPSRVVRIDTAADEVETLLAGHDVRAIACAPDRRSLWVGGQGSGVLRSLDGGVSWHPCGLAGEVVKQLELGSDGRLYAATKPPALFVSHDGGDAWVERPALRAMRRRYWRQPAERPRTPYVSALAVSPIDAGVVLVGIEGFKVLRSTDGGERFARLGAGLAGDCHELRFCPARPVRVIEAAGLGAAVSDDAGATWQRLHPRPGYAACLALDPADPDCFYLGSAPMLAAHGRNSKATVLRGQLAAGGSATFTPAGPTLGAPLAHLPYALCCPAPDVVVAGLRDGTLWRSDDRGEHWQRERCRLDGVRRLLVLD